MTFGTARAALVVAAGLIATGGPAVAQETNPQECVGDYAEGTDLFPQKVAPEYSRSWDISYHDNYKVVTVWNSLVEGSTVYTYVLVQCGTHVPPLEGDLADAQLVEIPVERVTFAATGIYPLDGLGVLDTLVGWGVGNLSQDTPFVRRVLAASGAVPIWDGAAFDMEAALNAELDVAFSWLEYGDFLAQGQDLGVPVVYSPANYESTALAASETIEFTAAFYNLEGAANTFMADLEESMAETLAAVEAVDLDGTFGHIYLSPEEFMRPHTRNYARVPLLESMGLRNVFDDLAMTGDTGPMGTVDFEGALARIEDDTVLIFGASGDQLLAQMADDDRYATLAPFSHPDTQIWVYRDPASLDFQCDAMLHFRPDVLLRDYAIAFAPELFPGEEGTCYVSLADYQQQQQP